jgi:hypothetical protein
MSRKLTKISLRNEDPKDLGRKERRMVLLFCWDLFM